MSKNSLKVKRNVLSDFLIKIKSDGGVITDGEITSVFFNETHKFKDINDMLRILEQRCDAISYPQRQRKPVGWDG